MSSNMPAPYKTLLIILEILKLLNYSYFAKIMTRKPKIGNLTNMTELYPFLESKKSDFVATLLHMKTKNSTPTHRTMPVLGHLACTHPSVHRLRVTCEARVFSHYHFFFSSAKTYEKLATRASQSWVIFFGLVLSLKLQILS